MLREVSVTRQELGKQEALAVDGLVTSSAACACVRLSMAWSGVSDPLHLFPRSAPGPCCPTDPARVMVSRRGSLLFLPRLCPRNDPSFRALVPGFEGASLVLGVVAIVIVVGNRNGLLTNLQGPTAESGVSAVIEAARADHPLVVGR